MRQIEDLLSPEQRAAFGGYSVRYCDQLAPGQILHDEDQHVIYVRGLTDAEALVDVLNAEAARIRSREDEFFLWRCGIGGGVGCTSE
jgi:hypothetical protein